MERERGRSNICAHKSQPFNEIQITRRHPIWIVMCTQDTQKHIKHFANNSHTHTHAHTKQNKTQHHKSNNKATRILIKFVHICYCYFHFKSVTYLYILECTFNMTTDCQWHSNRHFSFSWHSFAFIHTRRLSLSLSLIISHSTESKNHAWLSVNVYKYVFGNYFISLNYYLIDFSSRDVPGSWKVWRSHLTELTTKSFLWIYSLFFFKYFNERGLVLLLSSRSFHFVQTPHCFYRAIHFMIKNSK